MLTLVNINDKLNIVRLTKENERGEQMKKLFTARQAGEYLGLSTPRQHVHELLKRGKFPEPSIEMDDGKRGTTKFWTQEQLEQFKNGKGV